MVTKRSIMHKVQPIYEVDYNLGREKGHRTSLVSKSYIQYKRSEL